MDGPCWERTRGRAHREAELLSWVVDSYRAARLEDSRSPAAGRAAIN